MDNITYKDPQTAFIFAIACKRLSEDENAANYAGNYMYMGSRENPDGTHRDLFKHIDTREYIA
jgi:hypothetical protein